MLTRKVLYHLDTSPGYLFWFSFFFFFSRFCLLVLPRAGLRSQPSSPWAFCIAGTTGIWYQTQFICWDGALLNFFPGWPQSMILLSLPLSSWDYRHQLLGLACVLPWNSIIYSSEKISFVGLGFDLTALCLQSRHSTARATPSVYFCSGYFGDGVLRTLCLIGLVLLISYSWVARITGVSHLFPAPIFFHFLMLFIYLFIF
jgi:hypothetical protein